MQNNVTFAINRFRFYDQKSWFVKVELKLVPVEKSYNLVTFMHKFNLVCTQNDCIICMDQGMDIV